MLRQIKELVDFSFVLEELRQKFRLDNGRNAVPPTSFGDIFIESFKVRTKIRQVYL